MAALNGFLSTDVFTGITNANLSSDMADFGGSLWPPYHSQVSVTLKSPLTTHWPVAANGTPINGFLAESYSADFYHRIHISPARLDLGNIVSTQTAPVTIWNAYLEPKLLLSIDGVDEGIELSGQPNPPLTFTALQERVWNVAITPDGPAVLDGELSWEFASGDAPKLVVTGNRVTAFPWRIDWADGVREKLTWATSIAQSKSGAEQRRAMRLVPRRNLSANLFLDKRERQFFDLAMFGWSARVWAIPVWFEIQLITSSVAAGSMEILCDTANRDFRANGLAILLSETAFHFETVEVLSVSPTKITLKRELLQSWPAGTRLYPARTARLEQVPSIRRKTDTLQSTSVDFVMTEPCEWPAVAPVTTYRGRPVFDAVPNESEDLTSQFQRLLLQLDNGSAAPVVTDTANLAFFINQHSWMLYGRAEQAAARSFFYFMSGRLKSVWIPTHADDLTLVAVVSNTATTMDVAWCGYARFGQVKTGRKDIRIQLRNGTVFYRRITAAAEISADVERLQFDSVLGVQVFPEDVMRISWLMLMRGDSDSIEIQHVTDSDGLATTQQIFRSVRDDDL